MKNTQIITLIGLGIALAGLAIYFAIGVEPGSDIRTEQMVKYEIQNATERQAICNDGSPAVYYYRAGADENIDKWLVHLEGGGNCASDEECFERWTTQKPRMTSNKYPDSIKGIGILSTNQKINPDFYNFNHVFVKYCSSDFWSGDNEHEIEGQTMYMKGQNIVDSLFEDLQNPDIITSNNLSEASHVLFAGSSAGAVGLVRNLDRIAQELAPIDVKGVNDSAWAYFIELAMSFGLGSPDEPGKASSEYHNARLDESCVEANEDEAYQCGRSSYYKQYIETPLFLYIDQVDQNLIEGSALYDQPEEDHQMLLDAYANIIRESVEDMEGVFSTRVGQHTALRSPHFNDMLVDGHSYQEILGNWYFDREGPKHVVEQ